MLPYLSLLIKSRVTTCQQHRYLNTVQAYIYLYISYGHVKCCQDLCLSVMASVASHWRLSRLSQCRGPCSTPSYKNLGQGWMYVWIFVNNLNFLSTTRGISSSNIEHLTATKKADRTLDRGIGCPGLYFSVKVKVHTFASCGGQSSNKMWQSSDGETRN